jgi:hypothetical protein
MWDSSTWYSYLLLRMPKWDKCGHKFINSLYKTLTIFAYQVGDYHEFTSVIMFKMAPFTSQTVDLTPGKSIHLASHEFSVGMQQAHPLFSLGKLFASRV